MQDMIFMPMWWKAGQTAQLAEIGTIVTSIDKILPTKI